MATPQLRPYQVKDLAFHIAQKKSLNLSDPGTGKTPTVCVYAYYHWSRHQRKTIWVMPKSLLKKNRKEMLRFTEFKGDDVEIIKSDFKPLGPKWKGPTKLHSKRVKKVTDQKGPDGKFIEETTFDIVEVCDLIAASDAKVFLCTFKFLSNNYEEMIQRHPDIDVLLVDELHMGYGGPGSGYTYSFHMINRHVNHFVGMTGTLIDGRLDSAFPAIHVIEPRYYGGYPGFIDEHAAWLNNFGKVERWKGEEKIQAILAKHAIQHTFEEVYGKEPVHFETVTVDMGPKCRAEYDKFHEQAMLELEDNRILDGSIPGVAVIRATQIMAHPETMLIAKGETTGKDEKVAEYAMEGRPMLLFAANQPEQERMVKLLTDCGLKVGLINANVSAGRRNQIDEDFVAGKLDAIVASGPTAAVGYNWERADHVINVSVDYKDVNFLQAYRRASRGTRKSVLRVTTLAYADSIDQRKLNILTTKSELANRVDPNRPVFKF